MVSVVDAASNVVVNIELPALVSCDDSVLPVPDSVLTETSVVVSPEDVGTVEVTVLSESPVVNVVLPSVTVVIVLAVVAVGFSFVEDVVAYEKMPK